MSANQSFIRTNRFLGMLFLSSLVVTACKKDSPYEIPETYNFDNVSYSGQTARLNMLEEMLDYAKTAKIQNAAALDAQKLKDMFANANNQFSDNSLNTSGKQIKSKTVDAEQAKLEAALDALALASQSTANISPSNGVAGIMMKNDGSSGYLLSANGVDLIEAVEKGVMGACFYYQASAVYLGSGEMDVDNTTVVEGEGTAMEHHWDECFGYFGVPFNFPTNNTDVLFWGEYADKRDALMGCNQKLMNAFLKGRAAISNKDLETRDAMIDTIRHEWELVAVATAIAYLNESIDNFSSNPAVKHHALSEAFGLIYALQFGGDNSITTAQVQSLLVTLADSSDFLQANFYNTTILKIQSTKDALVGYFSSLEGIKNDL